MGSSSRCVRQVASLLSMGCAGSKFDELPVLGHPSGLRILPSHESYLKEDHTVLKLREKIFSWSGDDCSVKDMEDRKWFKIEGSALSMTNKRTMTDPEGRVIAGYRKKLLSLHATAYITLEVNGETMVFATIRRKMQLTADIHVAGDIIAKKYDFMMGDIEDNPYKIAQVVRKIKMLMANDTYFLNIGPRVDIAFIIMSAFAIDELFSDDK